MKNKMQVIIDLQGCQTGSADSIAHTVALIRSVLCAAPAHQVRLALNSRFPDSIARLRHSFADLLPSDAILLCQLPDNALAAPASRSWLAHADDELRASFLASLGADLVFAPNVVNAPGSPAINGYSALMARCAYVFSLSDPVLECGNEADPDQARDYARRRAILPHADLIVVHSQQALARLDTLLDAYAPARCIIDANDGAALWDAFVRTQAALAPAVATTARPRLAYVSPLPPEKSGISDYSGELLPQLARFYDIELIIDQAEVDQQAVAAHWPRRSTDWFMQHGAQFDRVLYHFGNSMLHKHMFALLERHPGTVVLHDFYLGHVLHDMQASGYREDALQQALYASHGFSGVRERDRTGLTGTLWNYPLNKQVLDRADGMIVHSTFACNLAETWYGPGAANSWQVLPLLRGRGTDTDPAQMRRAARAELGLDDDQFMVCSFGVLGPTKLNEQLVDAWLASALVRDPAARLVFVGDAGWKPYHDQIMARVGDAQGVKITGFVSQQMYQTYLAACDGAVQLRAQTRGETSAAVLDCLLHGAPTIVNAHGAIAELPDSVVIALPDQFETDALADALVRLRQDDALRTRLSDAAREHVRTLHAPERVGPLYHAALERLAASSPKRHYQALLRALDAINTVNGPTEPDLIEVARAIDANRRPSPPRQLFVDISALVRTDLKSGIQRVVRSVLAALFAAPPAGFRVEPVYSPGGNALYRHARRYMQGALTNPVHDLDDSPIDARAGDVFLGLDLTMHTTHQNRAVLQQMKNRGTYLYFVVYDLLPVLRPDVFPDGSEGDFALWLHTISSVSDGLLCISRAVADELAHWLEANPPARPDPLQLGYFHLGADIDASAPTTGLVPGAAQILEQMTRQQNILMVGTIEPRKGHAQALSAFELLWQQGVQVCLMIVGRQGWMVDALVKRLHAHPENGKRLFWLPNASDEMLQKVYAGASGLLVASEGEGFGLPLIEAAQHGLSMIVRDLPVFREVSGAHAFYFSGMDAPALATAVHQWLVLARNGQEPSPEGMRWLNWAESAAQLTNACIAGHWYRSVAGQTEPHD